MSDVEGSTAEQILDYLYALIVSDGGFKEAISEGVVIGEEPNASLVTEVVDVLAEERILASEDTLFVRHPVRRSVPIMGNIAVEHRPAFVQQNGHLYVMETVDFTIMQKKNASANRIIGPVPKAGLSVFMYLAENRKYGFGFFPNCGRTHVTNAGESALL